MSNLIQHTLVEAGGQQFLTVVVDGKLMPPIDDSHPNFSSIKEVVEKQHLFFLDPPTEGDLGWFVEKFDVSETISKRFEKLSERVTSNGGKLFFDGDEIDGTVVDTILRFLDDGVEDFKPLVNYIEKIAANPEKHSRDQLYDWLRLHDTISITPEGDLIAYKGVSHGGTHPETGEECYRSGFSGTATVDGTTITGYIPNYVGAEVTMPRSQVAHDPQKACHTGLHVGTFNYAQSYAHGAMLAVRVNPRDVVSVPTDGGGAKIRVCRYVVEEIIEQPKDHVLVDDYSDEEDSDGTIDGVSVDLVVEDEDPAIKVGDFVRYAPYASNGWIGTVRQIDEHPDYEGGRVIVDRPTTGVGAGLLGNSAYWYSPASALELFDDPNADTLKVGDRVVDEDGDEGTVVSMSWVTSGLGVEYDNGYYGTTSLATADLKSAVLGGFWARA